MIKAIPFNPITISLKETRFFILTLAFTVGNIILPALCHLIPSGGKMLLPIFFFTLIGAYKFGPTVGLATALLSPLANNLLTGMPQSGNLSIVVVKGMLLAVAAAWIANRFRTVTLPLLAILIIGYVSAGAVIEAVISGSLSIAFNSLFMSIPGMVLQLFGGFFILRYLSVYNTDKTV